MARRRLVKRGQKEPQVDAPPAKADHSVSSNQPPQLPGAPSADGLLNVAWQKNNLVLVERLGGKVVIRERRAEYACFIRSTLDATRRRIIRDHPAVLGMKEEGEWLRVMWRSTREREELCQALHADGIQTYEGDVNPVRRFMTDNDMPHAAPRLGFLDIETDSRVPPRKAAEGNARILCWAVIGVDGRKRVGVLEENTDAAERKLLQRLVAVLEEYDQLAAWNGDKFDFTAIRERMRRRGVRVNWARWLLLDHMDLFVRMNTMAAESGEEKQFLALQSIAMVLLGEGKDDFDSSQTWEAWAAGGDERRRLVRYCVKDTDLLRRLEEKTGYIGLLQTLAETCNVFADSRGINPTIQAEGFLLKLGAEKGYRFPSNFRRGSSTKFKGAYVMDPQCHGITKNVHVGDFASLYPSIIVTWNMSPETLVVGQEHDDLEELVGQGAAPWEDSYSHAPITGRFFRTDQEGILPHAVKEVMRLRKEWNDEKAKHPPGSPKWVEANRKSTAYKIAANSFYGVIGSPLSRFFNRDVAESVTQAGAWLIQETIKAAEARNMLAVYGDTDSLFIAGCTRTEFEVFVQWCNVDFYPVALRGQGCKENLIKLAYEKEFERIIFTSAKRYCNPPEAPIWMSDLSFKPLGEVKEGDEVIGWEPGTAKQRAKLVKSRVVKLYRRKANLVKVTFESGRVLRCTPDHRWRTGRSRGNSESQFVTPKVGRTLAHVVTDPGECPLALVRDAAWLGGMFDGEGSLCSSGRGQVVISQSQGHNPEVCQRLEETFDKLGFEWSRQKADRYALKAGDAVEAKSERLRFLQWCQPVKGEALKPAILKTRFALEDRIVSVEPDGEGEVIGMTTTTGNYVAWGYASKNCGRYVHYKGTAADHTSKPEIKGLEFKRGDSIRLARQFQAQVVDLLLGGGVTRDTQPADQCVEDPQVFHTLVCEWQDRILLGDLELDDVVIAKRLNKKLHEYSRKRKKDGNWAKQLPHIELARKLQARGEDVSEGTKVAYFVADASVKGDVEYRIAAEWDGECDRYETWEKLSWPPTERLLVAAFPTVPWAKMFAKVRPKAPRAPRGAKKAALAAQVQTPTPQAKTAPAAKPGRRRRLKRGSQAATA